MVSYIIVSSTCKYSCARVRASSCYVVDLTGISTVAIGGKSLQLQHVPDTHSIAILLSEDPCCTMVADPRTPTDK